jgi:hypothetical protein
VVILGLREKGVESNPPPGLRRSKTDLLECAIAKVPLHYFTCGASSPLPVPLPLPCGCTGLSASYPLTSGGPIPQKQDSAASASASAAELAAIVERVKRVLPGAIVVLCSVHGGSGTVAAKDAVEVRLSHQGSSIKGSRIQ